MHPIIKTKNIKEESIRHDTQTTWELGGTKTTVCNISQDTWPITYGTTSGALPRGDDGALPSKKPFALSNRHDKNHDMVPLSCRASSQRYLREHCLVCPLSSVDSSRAIIDDGLTGIKRWKPFVPSTSTAAPNDLWERVNWLLSFCLRDTQTWSLSWKTQWGRWTSSEHPGFDLATSVSGFHVRCLPRFEKPPIDTVRDLSRGGGGNGCQCTREAQRGPRGPLTRLCKVTVWILLGYVRGFLQPHVFFWGVGSPNQDQPS